MLIYVLHIVYVYVCALIECIRIFCFALLQQPVIHIRRDWVYLLTVTLLFCARVKLACLFLLYYITYSGPPS